MGVRIFIDTVHVRYLRREPGERQESFGLLMVDGNIQHNILDFASASDIPQTLEALLMYCLVHEYEELWDFFAGHCDVGQSVEFDDDYYNHEDLQALMEGVKQDHDAGKE